MNVYVSVLGHNREKTQKEICNVLKERGNEIVAELAESDLGLFILLDELLPIPSWFGKISNEKVVVGMVADPNNSETLVYLDVYVKGTIRYSSWGSTLSRYAEEQTEHWFETSLVNCVFESLKKKDLYMSIPGASSLEIVYARYNH